MPTRPGDTTAAAMLGTWTDSDTAMQIVGTSLGIFGADLLDPEVALTDETPLRNALFDVLLSLVEGGALDMRPTDDGLYAFRWRPDYAVAGLSADEPDQIDISAPSPYLTELNELRLERDEALARAQFAEALAEERGRLLRLATSPGAVRSSPRRARRQVKAALEAREQSIIEALQAASIPDADTRDLDLGIDLIDLRDPDDGAHASAGPDTAVGGTDTNARTEAEGIDTLDDGAADEVPATAATKTATKPKAKAATKAAKPRATATKAATAKPAAAKTNGAKADGAKTNGTKTNGTKTNGTKAPAEKAPAAKTNGTKPPAKPRVAKPKAPAADANDVVYLASPSDDVIDLTGGNGAAHPEDDGKPRRAKWSGYTLDTPVALSSAENGADEH